MKLLSNENCNIYGGYYSHNQLLKEFISLYDEYDCIISHGYSQIDENEKKIIYISYSPLKEKITIKNNFYYVVHYKSLYDYLKNYTDKVYFVPMVIDNCQFTHIDTPLIKTSKFIYFGNLYSEKINSYSIIKKKLNPDTISFNHFNGIKIVDKNEVYTLISRYKYGIGVGKCAQEMISMGLNVLISGNNNSGLIVTQEHFDFHIQENCNSSISNSLTNDVSDDINLLVSSKRKKILLPSKESYFNSLLEIIKTI